MIAILLTTSPGCVGGEGGGIMTCSGSRQIELEEEIDDCPDGDTHMVGIGNLAIYCFSPTQKKRKGNKMVSCPPSILFLLPMLA